MSRATRRGVMGGMAALIPAVAAVPAAAALQPDAELVSACARYVAAEQLFSDVCKAEPNQGPARDAWEAEEARVHAIRRDRLDEVLALPCAGLAGTHALARALVACKPEVLTKDGYDDVELVARLVRAVLALPQEGKANPTLPL